LAVAAQVPQVGLVPLLEMLETVAEVRLAQMVLLTLAVAQEAEMEIMVDQVL
jgi:hypothetical protein